jgi:hypothetical protein
MGSFKRMSTKCRACGLRENCDDKMMEGECFLETVSIAVDEHLQEIYAEELKKSWEKLLIPNERIRKLRR